MLFRVKEEISRPVDGRFCTVLVSALRDIHIRAESAKRGSSHDKQNFNSSH